MTSLHNIAETDIIWDNMTYAEKKHLLYLKQMDLLDQFLKRGAITQKQHDKSLHDLSAKIQLMIFLSISHAIPNNISLADIM